MRIGAPVPCSQALMLISLLGTKWAQYGQCMGVGWLLKCNTKSWEIIHCSLVLTCQSLKQCLIYFLKEWNLWGRKYSEREYIFLISMWFGKTLESPLDCKEFQPVHSEGDQPWGFFGSNDAKAETPVLWLPHAKSWLIGKDSDAGRDWGQEEKGTTENEMAGWHHRLEDLSLSELWELVMDREAWHAELDTTEQLN